MADRKTHEGVTYLKVAALQNSDGDHLCDMCAFELDKGIDCAKKFKEIFNPDRTGHIALSEVDLLKYLARKLTQ